MRSKVTVPKSEMDDSYCEKDSLLGWRPESAIQKGELVELVRWWLWRVAAQVAARA